MPRDRRRHVRGSPSRLRAAQHEIDGDRYCLEIRLAERRRIGKVATTDLAANELNPQGIVVDTHVRRISQRLALTRQEDPVKIERDLMRLVPRAEWARFPHLLIWHGRRICDARKPACEECPLAADLCPSSRV